MSASERASPEGGAAAGAGAGAAAGERPHHARSFKLRFAAQREPGRSYVSAVKPLGLPATVTGKFYARGAAAAADEARTRRALARIRGMFGAGPRERLAAPLTSAHHYGWWRAEPGPRRAPDHRIRDSAWLKERVRVLAADASLKRPRGA